MNQTERPKRLKVDGPEIQKEKNFETSILVERPSILTHDRRLCLKRPSSLTQDHFWMDRPLSRDSRRLSPDRPLWTRLKFWNLKEN